MTVTFEEIIITGISDGTPPCEIIPKPYPANRQYGKPSAYRVRFTCRDHYTIRFVCAECRWLMTKHGVYHPSCGSWPGWKEI